MKFLQKLRTVNELRRQQYDYHQTCKYSKDWNWYSPYTYIKSMFYMECAARLVYWLQFTKVKPNVVTIAYGALGIIGGILLAIPNPIAILLAIAIFFSKGILDLADGHYARLTNQVSILGGQLDYYAGRIGTIAFYAGLTVHIVQTNPYVLVYFIPLWLIHRLDGRARTIDFICLLLLIHVLLS